MMIIETDDMPAVWMRLLFGYLGPRVTVGLRYDASAAANNHPSGQRVTRKRLVDQHIDQPGPAGVRHAAE
jgi:hypothetical protein